MRGLWLSVDRGVESEAEPQSVRQRTVVELVLLVLPVANSFAGLRHLEQTGPYWTYPRAVESPSQTASEPPVGNRTPRGASVTPDTNSAEPRPGASAGG